VYIDNNIFSLNISQWINYCVAECLGCPVQLLYSSDHKNHWALPRSKWTQSITTRPVL
jgi:hypothetical protein